MRARNDGIEDRLSDTLHAVGDQTHADTDDGFALISERLTNVELLPQEVVSNDSRMPWLSAAALILALVGGGIFFTIGSNTSSNTSPPADSGTAADEPVYYLPPASFDLSDGTTFYSTEPSTMEGSGIVIGRAIDNGYDNISLIAKTPNRPPIVSQTVEVTIDGRQLIRARFDPGDTAVEELADGSWIEYTGSDTERLEEIVSATSVVDGELRFESTDELELLAVVSDLAAFPTSTLVNFRPFPDQTQSATGQEPVDGLGVNIVTMYAENENALLTVGSLGGTMHRTTVNGQPGYSLEFLEQTFASDRTVSGLAWTLPSGQWVAVVGNMSEQELRAFVNELQPVDLETWLAALEAAGASTFESMEGE